MKKRPRTLSTNHYTLRVTPPDVDRESLAAPEPTPAGLVRAIECAFKKQLLTCAPDVGFEIRAAGLRRIRLVMKRFGDTAVVAGVLRGSDSAVESLTVCRAGLDNAEDDAALEAAGELITEDDNGDGARAIVETMIDQVRQQPTPLAVHIHFDEMSFDDPSVRIITHCLAESFFDQFGIEKSHHATDV